MPTRCHRKLTPYVACLVVFAASVRNALAADPGPPASETAVAARQAKETRSLAAAINQAGVELLDRLPTTENAIFSPSSISTAFAMVYAGARGDTARQLASTIHFPGPPENVAMQFASLLHGGGEGGYTFGARARANQGYGIFLSEVLAGSAADRAGLRAQDLILTIDGEPMRTEKDYSSAIESSSGKVAVCWYSFKDGKVRREEVELTTGTASATPSAGVDTVNALWLQEGFAVAPQYADSLKSGFGAEFSRADFQGNPSSAREAINRWIAQKTQGRISSLFGEDAIGSKTRLVLANTVYFRGEWEKPFPPSRRELVWKLGDESISVPELSQTDVFGYTETSRYQAVELPYKAGSVSMVLLLPKQDVPWSQFHVQLGTSIWTEALKALKPTNVRLVMPKFRVASRLALRDWYESKMPLPFSENADLRGISSQTKLKISAAVHQAFINVDEKGTEAGAASGIGIALKREPEAHFVADRPFALLLWDRQAGTFLFLGQLVRPGA